MDHLQQGSSSKALSENVFLSSSSSMRAYGAEVCMFRYTLPGEKIAYTYTVTWTQTELRTLMAKAENKNNLYVVAECYTA